MQLPRPDATTPSRRSLRQAERAREASTAAAARDLVTTRRQLRPARSLVPRPAPAMPRSGPPVVPPAARGVEHVIADHVLEGGDDVWLDGVVPRPTPVGSRVVREEPLPASARGRGGAWRRLPQLAVVGSLVAATIGYVAGADLVATAEVVPAFVRQEGTAAAAGTGADPLVVDPGASSPLVAGPDGLLRVSEDDQASRSGERTVLPGCDGVPPETAQSNGDIDEAYLCTLWDGTTQVRADAAVALTLLNEGYRAQFGTDLCLTDGYRSYSEQAALRSRKPGLAARAGTSEHGFGLAVDLCGGVESGGAGYTWLRANAGDLGFENPRWAQRGGSGPYEPWHWEYTAGQW